MLGNLSDTMIVKITTVDKDQFAYVGNPPSPALDSTDYTAYSWAAQTRCIPVTTRCIKREDIYGVGTHYKCPFAMEGFLGTSYQNTMSMAYFTDSSATNNVTQGETLQNPYYFAAIVAVNQNVGPGPGLGGEMEILSTVHGADLFAVFCNTTVYDVEYTSVNSTLTRFEGKLSNASLANIVQGAQQFSKVGEPNIIQGASIAALISTSAQGVADYFALTYSQVALGVATTAFTPQPAIASHARENVLVAQVPKAALACLLLANLSLAALGIALTASAFWAVRGETGEVQARLSFPAVVASQFEGRRAEGPVERIEDIFEERQGAPGPRIGLIKSGEGGWKFGIWQSFSSSL